MWIAISEIVARVNEYGNLAAILNKCSWNEIKGESFEQLYCNKACCFINALHILDKFDGKWLNVSASYEVILLQAYIHM